MTKMDLILWRHAEAEDGIPDAKRKLTPHGEKQAKRMAHWLKERLPDDARILTSPALRCVQTAQALYLPFEESKQLSTSANATDLLAAAGWADDAQKSPGTVVIVGHQPTLGQVAAMLLAGREFNWQIKKAAAWWFSFHRDEVLLRAMMEPTLL